MEQLKVDFEILKYQYQDNVYATNYIEHYHTKFMKTYDSKHLAPNLKVKISTERMSQLELILKKYGRFKRV